MFSCRTGAGSTAATTALPLDHECSHNSKSQHKPKTAHGKSALRIWRMDAGLTATTTAAHLENKCSHSSFHASTQTADSKCGQQTWRMDAVSEHSTMKVDSPAMMRSEAPSRVKILSATERRQEAAGTQQPIWASTTAKQVALSRVLLPPIFGPVNNKVLACLHICAVYSQCQRASAWLTCIFCHYVYAQHTLKPKRSHSP